MFFFSKRKFMSTIRQIAHQEFDRGWDARGRLEGMKTTKRGIILPGHPELQADIDAILNKEGF